MAKIEVEISKAEFDEAVKSGVEQAMKDCELTIGMTLKEAVERQIPKPIDNKSADDLVCGCHNCGEINALWKPNGDRNSYCGNCGQKILWRDN